MTAGFEIEKPRRDHRVDGFDCSKDAFNHFLRQFSLQNQQAGASQTYVALQGEEVVGFYKLVFGQAAFDDAPERLRKGVAYHPVPLVTVDPRNLFADAVS